MPDPPAAAALEVLAARAPALVQDAGRPGFMHHGVPPGGAMVPEWLAAANHGVGNALDAAAIELFGALEVRARGGALRVALDDGAPRALADGDALTVAPRAGARVAYLAVEGGVDVPVALGGRGTLLVARLGGLAGRALRRGDVLAIGRGTAAAADDDDDDARAAAPSLGDPHRALRVVPGPDAARFAPDALAALARDAYRLDVASDRVGTRLVGPAIVRRDDDRAGSTPMVRGAIQVPAGGQPIVLGPDHPTTGGYPVIATVVRADWGALGARVPGAPVRFVVVSADDARAVSGGP